MTKPAPKLTAITLGVRDVPASARFYEALGFERKVRSTGDEIVFLQAGGVVLALWDWDKLAEDTVISSQPRPQTFRGMTLAWNCATPAEVDAIFEKALAAGRGCCDGRKKRNTAATEDILPIRMVMPGRLFRRQASRRPTMDA